VALGLALAVALTWPVCFLPPTCLAADYILSIRVEHDVVPLQPLGIFKGLDLPCAPSGAQNSMQRRWEELENERNAWKDGVMEELANA